MDDIILLHYRETVVLCFCVRSQFHATYFDSLSDTI